VNAGAGVLQEKTMRAFCPPRRAIAISYISPAAAWLHGRERFSALLLMYIYCHSFLFHRLY